MNDKPGNKKKIPIFAYYIILLGIVLIISYTMLPKLMEPDYKEISFSEFVQKVENDEAQQVEVNSKQYTMKPKDFETSNVYYVTGNINNEFHESTALLSLLDEKGIKYDSPIVSSNIWLEILIAYVLPTVIMVVLFVVLMRSMNKRMGGGVMSFGKNTSKIYAEKSTGKTFADVAGQDEAKQNLVEIIDFLNNPGKYTAIGAKLPKGALLVGPPGTGKSQTITALIANALTKGKTVLFVAEKRAALEVVQKRLAALGIDDFCLKLHSNKATKKAVLNQLRRGLEIDMEGTKTDYEQRIADIHAMRTELDAYAKALHKKRNFGKSLRQLIDLYESIPETKEQVKFPVSDIKNITEV